MEDYKCSKCQEYTVFMMVTWCRSGVSYDELMWHTYECIKCYESLDILAEDDDTMDGATIYF